MCVNKLLQSMKGKSMSEDKHDARKKLQINAKKKDILEVAQAFGMSLNKNGSSYQGEFQGHDTFTIYPGTNTFLWHGRGLNKAMSVVDLVSVLKFGATTQEELDANFHKSVVELNKIELSEFVPGKIPEKKEFKYFFEESSDATRAIEYLENERGISRETIDHFINLGVIAQAEWRNELEDGSYFFEPVVIFKNLDSNGRVIGGSAQGIEAHPEIPGHTHKSGHLKRVLSNSGSNSGLKISIGTPKNVVLIEAPIDLISYYDLYKDRIKDTILVAADGYKPEAYWKAMAEVMLASPLLSEEMKSNKEWALKHLIEHPDQLLNNYQSFIDNSDNQTGQFIFAFDNDIQGRNFIEKFKKENASFSQKIKVELPTKGKDWNEQLQLENKKDGISQSKSEEIEPNKHDTFSNFSETVSDSEKKSNPSIRNESPTQFIKVFLTREDKKGKPRQVTQIFELDEPSNISELKTDLSGRLSLDVLGVLTLDKKKEDYQDAKYALEKKLKKYHFVLSYNFAKEHIEYPSPEEIQKFKKHKKLREAEDLALFNIQNDGSQIEASQDKKVQRENPKTNTTTPQSDESTLFSALENRDSKTVNNILEKNLDKYKESKNFKNFLDTLSFMPDLSEKNIRLLLEQYPHARFVKEFEVWSKAYNRKIKYKSKALKLFVLSPQPQWDKKGNMKLDDKGQPLISKTNEQLISVFDISQTEEFFKKNQLDTYYIPNVSTTLSREKVIQTFQELSTLSNSYIHFTSVPLERDDKDIHFENSWYLKEKNTIYIQEGLPPEKALQTLIQELAYQKYFDKNLSPELQKLEVLSMTYIMLRQVGLETQLDVQNIISSVPITQLQQELKNIQTHSKNFSDELHQILKPKVQHKVAEMTVKDKMENLSFQERMSLAKQKHEDFLKEKSSRKKVQGVQQVQAI